MSSGAFRANVLPPIFGEKIAFVYFSIIGVVRRGRRGPFTPNL